MNLLIQSLEFAAGKHGMQRRNDEEASPYINHPDCAHEGSLH